MRAPAHHCATSATVGRRGLSAAGPTLRFSRLATRRSPYLALACQKTQRRRPHAVVLLGRVERLMVSSFSCVCRSASASHRHPSPASTLPLAPATHIAGRCERGPMGTRLNGLMPDVAESRTLVQRVRCLWLRVSRTLPASWHSFPQLGRVTSWQKTRSADSPRSYSREQRRWQSTMNTRSK